MSVLRRLWGLSGHRSASSIYEYGPYFHSGDKSHFYIDNPRSPFTPLESSGVEGLIGESAKSVIRQCIDFPVDHFSQLLIVNRTSTGGKWGKNGAWADHRFHIFTDRAWALRGQGPS
jgi:hypothetical protein